MNRIIYKYPFAARGVFYLDVTMAAGDKVVHVAAQRSADELPTLWIEHDASEQRVGRQRRRFVLVGTGQPCLTEGRHVGSAICGEGMLVWHVYEQREDVLSRDGAGSRAPEVQQETTGSAVKKRAGDQDPPTVNDHPDIQNMVIADIEARRLVGIERYGTALQPFNGRDVFRDLYEELLDAACYVKQAMVERDAAAAIPIGREEDQLSEPAGVGG